MNFDQILLRPIPDQTGARGRIQGRRGYPIVVAERNSESVVDLALYGIPGQSYYSRPNWLSDVGFPGVSKNVFVRQSIAERLSDLNFALQRSVEVERLFGRKVELYVDEGLRSPELQAKLHDVLLPDALRKRHPHLSEQEILAWRNRLIAKPSPDSPEPHLTGAAVDIKLRYAREEQGFVAGSFVPMGARSIDNIDAAALDYYEHKTKLLASEVTAQRNRRAYYWIMRGALLEADSGFICNPNEWWHWSCGDQMWAAYLEAPYAFYGAVKVEGKDFI